MIKFPLTHSKCSFCQGTGEVDTAYQGSAMWEPCPRCKGKKDVLYSRVMTTDEKLIFLLHKIDALQKGE